jgi:hypothetical protein
MERERARLLEDAAAKEAAAKSAAEKAAAIGRDMDELDRIAAKYNLVVRSSPEGQSFDGSVASLVDRYQNDPHSPFPTLRYRTRENYKIFLRRIVQELGQEQVATLDQARLDRIYDEWKAGGHIALAHTLMGTLQRLAGFGSTVLKDQGCRLLRGTLHDMHFPLAKSESEPLTAEMAVAIRRVAHSWGFHSLALAQAIQFECPVRQKDVIGEWVPISEPGTSEIIEGKMKWLLGLRWSSIDENLILRHTTSMGAKAVTVDLRGKRMVMEELAPFLADRPTKGPVIVFEPTGRPYSAVHFRELWRKIADEAGVPRKVKNRNSLGGYERQSTEDKNRRASANELPGAG